MNHMYFLSLSFLFSSCIIAQDQPYNRLKTIKLDFSDCTIISNGYEVIQIEILKGFRQEKVINEGICEYRFKYKNGAIAYVTSDVWYGSELNYGNRLSVGHDSYNKGGLLDTIKLGGLQKNGLFWSEQIIGDIMVGYRDAPIDVGESLKSSFSKMKKF